MEVVDVPVGKLKPAEYNPRRISSHDYESLKRSLKEFGCVDPIIVNQDMTVIGGHQRLKAAAELGWSEVPCIVLDLSEEKAKVLNLALNRISGEWDEYLLRIVLAGLSSSDDIDASLSGFSTEEIDRVMSSLKDSGVVSKKDIAEYEDKIMGRQRDLSANVWDSLREVVCPNCGARFMVGEDGRALY